MNYQWHDLAGNLGVSLIVLAYLALQLGKTDPEKLGFSVVNAAGAGLVLVSLWNEFNLSAFLVEVFWLLISVLGMARCFMRRAMTS